jgi:hypothetical protein
MILFTSTTVPSKLYRKTPNKYPVAIEIPIKTISNKATKINPEIKPPIK